MKNEVVDNMKNWYHLVGKEGEKRNFRYKTDTCTLLLLSWKSKTRKGFLLKGTRELFRALVLETDCEVREVNCEWHSWPPQRFSPFNSEKALRLSLSLALFSPLKLITSSLVLNIHQTDMKDYNFFRSDHFSSMKAKWSGIIVAPAGELITSI